MATASLDAPRESPLGCPDIDRIELPELDSSLLTALLEESLTTEPEVDDAVDACSSTRSPAATYGVSVDGRGHDDVYCDQDGGLVAGIHLETTVSTPSMDVDDSSYLWMDMDAVVPCSPTGDMGNWFMGTSEVWMVDYHDSGDTFDHLYSCDGVDVAVEYYGYSPLWQ